MQEFKPVLIPEQVLREWKNNGLRTGAAPVVLLSTQDDGLRQLVNPDVYVYLDLEADGTGLDLGLVSQKQEDVTCMVGMGLGHTMGDVVRLLQSEAYVVPVHYFALTTNSQAVHSLLAYLLASLAMTVRANRDFRRGVVELALSLGKGVKLKGEVSYQQAPWLFEK